MVADATEKATKIAEINAEDGTATKPYTNLMKAINTQYANNDLLSGTVNIHISKGDHYMIFCDDSISANDYANIEINTASSGFSSDTYINYCGDLNKLALYKSKYPNSDKLIFNIKALRCDNSEFGDVSSICMDQTAATLVRPILYVNSEYMYFNITN